MTKLNLSKKALYRTGQEYSTRMNQVRLGFNELIPSYDDKIVKEILNSLSGETFSAYPQVNESYNALEEFHNISKDHFLLGHGSDGVLFQVLLSLCNKKTRILTLAPTFGMYEVYSKLIGCKFQTINYTTDRMIDLNVLSNSIKEADVFLLANPNGVIGKSFSKEELINISNICFKEKILFIIDEAYIDFGGISCISQIDKVNNLIVIRSFSKGYGMAGLRIGYAITNPRLLDIIRSMKPVVEINTVAAIAIPILLKNKLQHIRIIKEIIASKEWFILQLRQMNFNVIETDTNFVLVDFGQDREHIFSKLIDHKIEFKKLGDNFENFCRITVGKKNIMQHVVNILKKS